MATPALKSNAQYGDMKRLAQLSSGMKQGNADSVPTLRNPVGRPAGSTSAPAPAAAPTGAVASGIPEEHMAIMDRAARAMRTANIGRQMAADPLAGPFLRMYAQMAEQEAADRLRDVKALTPDYASSE